MSSWVEQRKATRRPEDKQTRGFMLSDITTSWTCLMQAVLEGASWCQLFGCILFSPACWSSQKQLQSQQEINPCKVLVPQARGEHKRSVITGFFSLPSSDFSSWFYRALPEQTLCVTFSDISQQPPVLLLHSKCTIYPHMFTLHLLQ